MSTPQPIPPRLTPSAIAGSPSPRPSTATSLDPPTPRPSQLPFPSASSTTTTTTITTDDTIQIQQQQQPPFLPFFTLIQDATTSSHFHPTVRYVFSDDEFDPLSILPPRHHPLPPAHSPSAPNSLSNSAAAAAAAGLNQTPGTGDNNSGSGSQADVDSNSSGHFSKAGSNVNNNRGLGGRNNDRIILVDIAADGQGILSAHSLSPDWQISGVSVTKAPTWMSDGDGGSAAATATGEVGGDGGLMLTIDGVGKGKRKVLPGTTAGIMDPMMKEKKTGGVEALEELVGLYQERLERLQGVVDWAEGRKGVEGDAAVGEGS